MNCKFLECELRYLIVVEPEIFVFLTFNYMDTKNTNLNRDKYLRVSELGSELGLSFSSHLELADKVIGLDGIQRKILVCEFKDEQNVYQIIPLDKVKSISVKRTYSGIKPGELNERRFEEFIKSIDLKFECSDEDGAISLPFYEEETDDAADLAQLESKVKNWQLVLSKMIGISNKGVIKEIDFGDVKPLNKCSFHVTTVFK